MYLRDAVIHLHPEYRAHRRLSAAIAGCYPAAIPKDLVNLIKSHLGFEQPKELYSTKQQLQADYDDFITKYGAVPLNNAAGGLQLDLNKLKAAFPHCSDLNPGNIVQIKCIEGTYVITKNVVKYLLDDLVVVSIVMDRFTGNYLGRLRKNSIYVKLESKISFDYVFSQYLPFNLYGEQRGEHKYLVDPVTMESIQIIDTPNARPTEAYYADRARIFSAYSSITLSATVV